MSNPPKSKGRRPKHTNWSDVDLAYLAGYIDADGMIGLWKISAKGNKSGLKYKVAIEVDSVREEILIGFQNYFGLGKVYKRLPRGRNGKNSNARPLHKWRLNAAEIRALLPRIMPHLKAKKQQAQIALQYLNMTKPRQRQTAEALQIMEQMKIKMTKLNKRGI